ncbi:NAD(P)H-quinone oxidoreductase subunit T, chloroplastic isoform X2 [Rhodamnia argentea]|uniref:NAD(P)H-quinone oxidoreductase subunit T, chloroplastic isoform X2 n=1 Tax=Rhodamnia argentea TaxID=178133 RepID=A0A8B8NZX2_9MYRT|nr:NAD(P)H-quinone oxidoreductase subunit T, chloroplastic isoform X3 [Rhodamnia argentea]XP_048127863.1 NAD(P)H-quinone oxidoreductase subunit T, chloroplastic isoform X2 [Rhodamnia argentea]
MASTAPPPQALFYLFTGRRRSTAGTRITQGRGATARVPRRGRLRVSAAQGVDTRIHWENEDEGWIGGGNSRSEEGGEQMGAEEERRNLLGEKFADLLNESSDSHYQFLGISAGADLEEIKAAYRRLSKEYHPDTTSLPLKTASDKFLKLREVYKVLSDEERRRFYDWTLAQEAASRQAEKMRMSLEDPYEQDLQNYKPVPDMVDRLSGRNMDLSDQAMSALTFDVFIIIFAICCIIYVIYFKEPYY